MQKFAHIGRSEAGAADEVAEERGIRPCAAVVRGDPREVEQRLFGLGVELELLAPDAGRRGKLVTGLGKPLVHGRGLYGGNSGKLPPGERLDGAQAVER